MPYSYFSLKFVGLRSERRDRCRSPDRLSSALHAFDQLGRLGGLFLLVPALGHLHLAAHMPQLHVFQPFAERQIAAAGNRQRLLQHLFGLRQPFGADVHIGQFHVKADVLGILVDLLFHPLLGRQLRLLFVVGVRMGPFDFFGRFGVLVAAVMDRLFDGQVADHPASLPRLPA